MFQWFVIPKLFLIVDYLASNWKFLFSQLANVYRLILKSEITDT